MKEITSFSNPIIKSIRALHDRKGRQKNGLFLVEGLQAIGMAFEAGIVPEQLLYVPDEKPHALLTQIIRAVNTRSIIQTTPEILAKISVRDNPQTVLGVYKQRWADVPAAPTGLWLALENMKDPGNVGTILRTADAVGVQGIVLVGECCDPYSVEAVRASMGSIFSTPLLKMTLPRFTDFAQQWRTRGTVLATSLKATADHRTLKTTVKTGGPVLLMMGNEQKGLPAALEDLATVRVKIPMRGRAESLNVAVATAIVLYQLYDQVA